MKNKNCLVTGGSGFVGSHLAKRLIDLGCNVTIIDIVEPDSLISNDVEFFNINIYFNVYLIYRIIRTVSFW